MTVSKTASSCAALSLVAAIGLTLPATPATAAEDPHISEIGYTLDTDFIEIAAEPGTDVSGWTFGSVDSRRQRSGRREYDNCSRGHDRRRLRRAGGRGSDHELREVRVRR